MGLFDLFRNQQLDESMCLIRDMIAMTVADGEIAPEEESFLQAVIQQEGFDFDRYADRFDNPYQIRDAYPKTYDEKMEYLKKLVAIMLVDGECSPEEVRFCNIIAKKMGLTERDVARYVAQFVARTSAHDKFKGMGMFLSYVSNGGYTPDRKQ